MTGICSKCKDHADFEKVKDSKEPVSVCCGKPAVKEGSHGRNS